MESQIAPVLMPVEEQLGRVAEVAAEAPPLVVDRALVARLVGDAQRDGVAIDGEGGLLAQLTRLVVESALEGELTAHLGYAKHERAGDDGDGNARNGTRTKTILTMAGPIEIDVPRDRAGTFEPVVVKKRQRHLGSIEDIVLSLSARGMTHGDITAHLADVYGSDVSKTTISTITDKVLDGMAEWQGRPLDPVYPEVFIDAIHVKIRDGQIANRPIYVALAVTAEGNRDILGLWAGDGDEGVKYWQHVLTEIKNRGVADVLMVVCGGPTGLPDAVNAVWPKTLVQACTVHLMRNSFNYSARQGWDAIARAMKPIYQAATVSEAEERFPEFVPFLGFDRLPPPDRLHDQRDRVRERSRLEGCPGAGPLRVLSKPRRNASTSPSWHSTRPAEAAPAGPNAGSKHSTRSTSDSTAASARQPSKQTHSYTENLTDISTNRKQAIRIDDHRHRPPSIDTCRPEEASRSFHTIPVSHIDESRHYLLEGP